jgi:hypothetical protein
LSALKNTRHEAFVQALVRGESATSAYCSAGYRSSRSNAARLRTNELISNRERTLREAQLTETRAAFDFSAKSLFAALSDIIDAAREAGDYKTAARGLMYIIRWLGYADNPALTHERLTGRIISISPRPKRLRPLKQR